MTEHNMIPFKADALKYNTVSESYTLGRPDNDKNECEWSKAKIEVRHEMKKAISEINQVMSQIKEARSVRCIGLTVENKSADSEHGPERNSKERSGSMDLDSSTIKKLIIQAVKKLPTEEQLVLSLYYCDGMNVEEIGDIIGVRPAGISRLFKRAMLDLLSRMKDNE